MNKDLEYIFQLKNELRDNYYGFKNIIFYSNEDLVYRSHYIDDFADWANDEQKEDDLKNNAAQKFDDLRSAIYDYLRG